MNSVEKFKKEVEGKEAELKKLTDELGKLRRAIEERDRELSIAKDNYLVEGNDKARAKIRERIKDLDEKRQEMTWRLERTEKKVHDGDRQLNEARGALSQAEAERKARLAAFIQRKETEHWNQYVSSLPEEQKEIMEEYIKLCEHIAEVQINGVQILPDGTAQRSREMEKFFWTLTDANGNEWKGNGYKRLNWAGWPDAFYIVPLVHLPEGAVPDAGAIATFRRAVRLGEYETEFQREEK